MAGRKKAATKTTRAKSGPKVKPAEIKRSVRIQVQVLPSDREEITKLRGYESESSWCYDAIRQRIERDGAE